MSKIAYDIVIIGGGLAGTSLAILCARDGLSVALLEKDEYPRQKVCGEYISRESYDFLQQLGLPISELNLPHIDTFRLTSLYGLQGTCRLTKGGIGISRYMLDGFLAEKAREAGAEVLTKHKVAHVHVNNDHYEVAIKSKEPITARLVVGAFGRQSGLQPSLATPVNNFIGVKYHVADGPPDDTIEIHHFRGGYCGISKVEDEKYCMCYLVKASVFTSVEGDIHAFEDKIMAQNPYLADHLQHKRLTPPITTSGLVFKANTDSRLPYPVTGDAAGFIPPITGNGMSLAFRSAKRLHALIPRYLNEDKKQIMNKNKKYISGYLAHRINKGVFLQDVLLTENERLSRLLLKGATHIPGLLRVLSNQAVGADI